jgi:hypothetical protein
VMSGRRAQGLLQAGAARAYPYALVAVCLAGVFVAAGVGVSASASTKVATAARAYVCRQPMQRKRESPDDYADQDQPLHPLRSRL